MKSQRLRVTIDIFSGRENPVIEFSGKELKEISKKLSPIRKFKTKELTLPPIPTLGYRGLIVEQIGMPIKELPNTFRIASGIAFGRATSYMIADDVFEEFVCGSVPKGLPIKVIRKEIARFKELTVFWDKWHWEDHSDWFWPRKKKCKCAPIYEPDWWNVSTRQPFNNCYNYATNYRTNTYAHPGQAGLGVEYCNGDSDLVLDCSEVKAGAVADELIDSPNIDNKCPSQGHLVALVIWPGVDYHWYRKDKNRRWSHKPGGTAITNLDNSGNIIVDPRNADRGGYERFCTFMVVKHGHIKII